MILVIAVNIGQHCGYGPVLSLPNIIVLFRAAIEYVLADILNHGLRTNNDKGLCKWKWITFVILNHGLMSYSNPDFFYHFFDLPPPQIKKKKF